MSDLRTTLGDLRRAEKDIIINYNNAVEVGQLRERWGKSLAALRKSLGEVRGCTETLCVSKSLCQDGHGVGLSRRGHRSIARNWKNLVGHPTSRRTG